MIAEATTDALDRAALLDFCRARLYQYRATTSAISAASGKSGRRFRARARPRRIGANSQRTSRPANASAPNAPLLVTASAKCLTPPPRTSKERGFTSRGHLTPSYTCRAYRQV